MVILNFINNFKCWNCPLLLFACQVKFNFAQQNPMIKECALNNQEHILFHSRFATALRIMIIIIIVIRIHLSAMEINWWYCWIEPKFLLGCACGLCVIILLIIRLENRSNWYFRIDIILPYTIKNYTLQTGFILTSGHHQGWPEIADAHTCCSCRQGSHKHLYSGWNHKNS